MSAATAGRPGPGAAARVRAPRARLLDRPLTSYYLVLGITVLLLALGLIMVLSTSSANALDNGGAPYAGFQKQLVGVVVGLPLMWIAAKSSPRMFRAAAYPLIIASVVGLVAVLSVGRTVYGAERWIQVAGFQLQPSEFAKLALVLWGADLLARKEKLGQLTDWRQLLIPLMPGAVDPVPAGDAGRRPRHHLPAAGHLPDAAVGDRHAGPDVHRHARAAGLRHGAS